jgi:hypothetical protein
MRPTFGKKSQAHPTLSAPVSSSRPVGSPAQSLDGESDFSGSRPAKWSVGSALALVPFIFGAFFLFKMATYVDVSQAVAEAHKRQHGLVVINVTHFSFWEDEDSPRQVAICGWGYVNDKDHHELGDLHETDKDAHPVFIAWKDDDLTTGYVVDMVHGRSEVEWPGQFKTLWHGMCRDWDGN